MKKDYNFPNESYGVRKSESSSSFLIENFNKNGFLKIRSTFGKKELNKLRKKIKILREEYINTFGEEYLKSIDEINSVRAPLIFDDIFLEVALDKKLIKCVKDLIDGDFILNQSNLVINPPKKSFNQGFWHRDIPYQHFTISKPISVNALFCVDDFTKENGSTALIPGSHLFEDFPSKNYIENSAIQVEAKAGEFIIMNSMVYHGGSKNLSKNERIGINHVFSIPFFKQQINLKKYLQEKKISGNSKKILGLLNQEPNSLESFFRSREK